MSKRYQKEYRENMSNLKWTVLAHLESQLRRQNFQTQNLVDRSSPPYTTPNKNTNKHI